MTRKLAKDLKSSRIVLRYQDFPIFSEIEEAGSENICRSATEGSWAAVVRGERAQSVQKKKKEEEKKRERETRLKRIEMEENEKKKKSMEMKERERRERQRKEKEAAKREEERRKRREWKKIKKDNKRWEEMERLQEEENQKEKERLEEGEGLGAAGASSPCSGALSGFEVYDIENKKKKHAERKKKEQERSEKEKNTASEVNEDEIAKAKAETRKFEVLVKSLGMDEGDKRKKLREAKIIGEEMMGLIENVDGIKNISDCLKKKRKNIVTALNSLMDLNDLNIAKLEQNLEEVTSASVRGQEGLGATGASSPCSGALSGSVANDRGHLFYLHTKKAF